VRDPRGIDEGGGERVEEMCKDEGNDRGKQGRMSVHRAKQGFESSTVASTNMIRVVMVFAFTPDRMTGQKPNTRRGTATDTATHPDKCPRACPSRIPAVRKKKAPANPRSATVG